MPIIYFRFSQKKKKSLIWYPEFIPDDLPTVFYLISAVFPPVVLMDGVVLRSVNHVWPLKCFPKFQPLRRPWEDLADPWPEPCDVGSFKLLGWELLITGTWNCLTHASPNCTTARQRTQPKPGSTSTICLSRSRFPFSRVACCATWWRHKLPLSQLWLPYANEKHMRCEFEFENGCVVVFPCVSASWCFNKYCCFYCKVLWNPMLCGNELLYLIFNVDLFFFL